MLVLPEEHRRLFKEPFGVLYRSIDEIIPLIKGKDIYSVGDVVTYNLQKKGIHPAVAVIDGYTMRSPCNRLPAAHGECIKVKNPAGTITDELTRALDHAVRNPPSTIIVDGEEDLAVIPLVLTARDGAVVLYGQPREGIVLRIVDSEARKTAHRFLDHFTRSDKG
ncbi:MAG: GTP-dependent dephospho-CoA kinase family protein [Methanoregula sp.]|nr:GTP-dependent dephospho-CoA kinase family protein [Methanoregula sp.]